MPIEMFSYENETWNNEYKYNLENRILIFNGEVDSNVVEDYIHYIIKWNREDKDVPVKKRKPITLFISSGGGDMFDGNALLDCMLLSKTKIRTVGISFVASMAYLIFLAGDERLSFPNTTFLQHDGELIIQNSSSKAKDTARFFEEIDERVKQYVLSRTEMNADFYDDIYDQEYWMTPQDAKQLGIVDKIIGEDCDIDEIL